MPPLKHQGLTEQQLKFAQEYIRYGSETVAAEKSGYSGNSSAVGYSLLRHPQIAAVIYAELSIRFKIEGATIAQNVLLDIARDKDAPKGVRADCAKALLDRAGFPAQRATPAKEGGQRALEEYSIDELRDMISRLEQDAAVKARDVTPGAENKADVGAPTTQALAMLE